MIFLLNHLKADSRKYSSTYRCIGSHVTSPLQKLECLSYKLLDSKQEFRYILYLFTYAVISYFKEIWFVVHIFFLFIKISFDYDTVMCLKYFFLHKLFHIGTSLNLKRRENSHFLICIINIYKKRVKKLYFAPRH